MLSTSLQTSGAKPKVAQTTYTGSPVNSLAGIIKTPTPTAPSSAAQNYNLQGADYFKNLQSTGTTAEQKAATAWLARNTPKPATTQPGMITPKPTTPVKSIVTPQGTTTFHAPTVPKTPTTQATPSSAPTQAPVNLYNPSTGINPSRYVPENKGIGGVSQGGLIGNLAYQSMNASPEYIAQQQEANRIAAERTRLAQEFAQKDQNINRTAGFLTQATGLEGQLQKQYDIGQSALSQQEASAASRLAAANQQQGLQVQAGTAAVGANAPITGVPYGTQVINPATGQPIGGGVSGTNPVQDIPNIAQQVASGRMTIDQANAALGNNIGLSTALRGAITQINPNFNFTQSSASAGTQQVGQQIYAAAQSANQALDTLSTAFSSLPGVQTGGIPATNSIANWIASQLGSSALTTYLTNLHDARSQLVGVLNSSGGTPTGNEATAQSYLPDNMTKAQFDKSVGTPENPGIVRQLIQQKLSSYQGSGVQQPSGGTTGGFAEAW
jgi:hypothetical protein